MKRLFGVFAAALAAVLVIAGGSSAQSADKTYDVTTLAGKVASLNGTAPLQIRFSAFIEQEAEEDDATPVPATPITPVHVPGSPLDATSVPGPAVTVNQDTAAAPQNETSIAVDPNNSSRIVAAANDYVTRSWSCSISGTPCSALGDGYSGTYFSNNGGTAWCCASSDPSHLGTLIPGVTRLAGGPYDAGGDPSVAFDSHGHVYYAGLGFNRASPPNTVAVNKGTFSVGAGGSLSWGAPTFINATTSPSTLNDKEWIAVDANASSPFRDRIYVTWTRFLFNPSNGSYVQSPIMFRVVEQRRSDLHRSEADLGQRAVRAGLASCRRARRHALRVLGCFDAARRARLDLDGEVDGRRGELEQADGGRDLGQHPAAPQHRLPCQQLPGRGGGAER
jgi:hypothetical protein